MCGNIRPNEFDFTILNHLHCQYLIKIYHISITRYIHFSLCIYSNHTCVCWIEYMYLQLKIWKIVKKYGRLPYFLIFCNNLKLNTKLSSCKVDHIYKGEQLQNEAPFNGDYSNLLYTSLWVCKRKRNKTNKSSYKSTYKSAYKSSDKSSYKK